MQTGKSIFVLVLLTVLCGGQTADQAMKLGAFVGRWKTEGAFTNGPTTSTTLECRLSPMGSYLVCDQLVNMGGAEHRQFTVYSYDSKAGNYSYTTLADPGVVDALVAGREG